MKLREIGLMRCFGLFTLMLSTACSYHSGPASDHFDGGSFFNKEPDNTFTDHIKDTTYSYQAPKNQTTGEVKDFAIFSRFPGPNQNVITIFSSTHDVGHISTVRYFTILENLNTFEEAHLNNKENSFFFDALFEVQGFSRTGFQPKLLHLGWLNEK